MSFLAQTILPYILLYKYFALFIITFLGSLALPIPAGTLLVASAAFASQGYFNIYVILAVVIGANMLGDNICYWLARWYGKRFLKKIGLRRVIESKNFKLIERGIAEKPGLIIFISRFEVIATLSVNIICGLGQVPYKKFLLFESIGAFADSFVYGMIGYLFADSWQAVNNLIGNFSIAIFLLIAVGMVFFWKKIMSRLSTEQVIKEQEREAVAK
jgi:membrane-associated protein